MKVLNKVIIGAIIFYACTIKLSAQVGKVYLNQDFEGTVLVHTPPAGWVPDSYGDRWYFWNGGWDQFTGFHNPAAAHSGSFNVMFKDFNVETSKLISPQFDISGTVKPVLTFWYAQELRSTTNDKLKLYYRTSTISSWVLLESYTNPTVGWVKSEIILPDAAKTPTCQLAFEGSTQNISWGVCIDDIKVEEKGILDRKVESLSLIQRNNFIPSGSSTNPIGAIGVVISGNTGNQTLNSISVEYTGTDINDLNINNSEIFYTRDTIFSPKIKLIPTISNTGNSITFSNVNYNLQTGDNYIWICVSVKSNAAPNNIVDFKLLQNSINISNVLFPGGTIEPSGTSTIEESILFDGFESSSGWQFSSGSCWQIGVPTGLGTNDPDFAYSGTQVLATNLSGNYPTGIRPSNPHTITSPLFNAKFYQHINLRFKRWLNFEYFDKTYIQCSVDGGTTWVNLWENNAPIQDQSWKNIGYNISQTATRKQNVKIRFSIDSTDLTGLYGGWNIDNFAITGDYIAKDLGVSGITSPINHCGMTSAETVTVNIKNYGGETVSGPYDVGFSLDNGATYTKETVNLTINSEQEVPYTFTAKANLSLPGLKQLKFKTFLTGDEDLSNDTYNSTLFVYPTLNYAYQNSFETSNGYWNPSGTNSTWAWGIPNATIIKTASDGTKAWVTNLIGNYNNSEASYLESPCFNFTSSEYPVFSFDYWVNTESGVDGFRLEYSINGGASWSPVPVDVNHTQNWCTATVSSLGVGAIGWTGNSGAYITAKTLLPASVNGVNGVKFRFAFASDSNNSFEGVSIDNIKIYELSYDVGLEIGSLTSPVSGCLIGLGINPVNVVANVKNFGYRPLKVGLKVPMEIKLNSDNVVKDTLLIGSIVNQNGSTSFTSTKTFNIIAKGTYTLKINTSFANDLNPLNDSQTFSLEVWGTPGYTLGPDKAVLGPDPFSAVQLDAGLGYDTYLWSTTETTQTINVSHYGTYSVIVSTNTGGHYCEAKDTIIVRPSDTDIQILSVAGLSDACTYPTSVKPTITIKNLGPNGFGPLYTLKSIPLSIMVDGVDVHTETFTPASGADVLVGGTADYTFTTGINLSTPKTYYIHIHSDILDDPDKSNNTYPITTNVWGMPVVNFPQDTIFSLNATSLTLDAGPGFATYVWENYPANDGLQSFTPISLNSATYKVTVTDTHSCGTASDQVYVNAKDLIVLSIDSPNASFCDYTNPHVSFTVKNTGRDIISSTEVINASYNTPSGTVSQDFTVGSDIALGGTKQFTFTDPVNIPIGLGYISVTANIYHYPKKSTNTVEGSFEKRPQPTVIFDPATLIRIFSAGAYEVIPNYSNNVQSYLWKDPYGNDIGTNPTYFIINSPNWRTLSVFAFDDINQTGCQNSATLAIVADDMALDNIKSPTNQCVLGNNIPVTFTILNSGNFTYPINTQLVVGLNVDGFAYPDTTITLTSDLLPNDSRDITLTRHLYLSNKTSSSIQVTISTSQDINASNNAFNKTVYATGYPNFTLGSDRAIHAWSEKLKPGNNYDTYAWSFNSTPISAPTGIDSTLTATQSGTYSVNVTDFNGCSNSKSVVLTFVVDDISLKTLDNPASGCGLNSSEPVQVTIENTGTETINSSIEIGFIQNGLTKKTQTFNLTSAPLLTAQTRQFDLTDQLDLSAGYITYPLKVWVKMTGDMRDNNDTLPVSIDRKPPVLFSFSQSIYTLSASDTTLDPGTGFASYLWNNGATTHDNKVFLTGDYWVDLTNIPGCKTRAAVHINGRNIGVNSLVAPQTTCTLSNAETITVKLENSGSNQIPKDSIIHLALKVNGTIVATESLALSNDLAKGGTINYTFTYKPNLSAASTYLINITASMSDRGVSVSNSKDYSVTVYGNPIPTGLGSDRNITGPTVLDAGSGFTSYTWQDGSHNQTFTAGSTGDYSVTVTNSNGCQGTGNVHLTFLTSDVQATQLVSPTSHCFNSQEHTVTAKLTNNGSRTFNAGESLKVSYQVNSNIPVVETMNFTSSFASGQSIDYTFTQKATIGAGSATIILKTIISDIDGTPTSYPITFSNPTFNLGPDTLKVQLPYTLKSGISDVTYLWNTGSTNASITVSTYGKYSLKITDEAGCIAQDSIVIASLTSVEVLPGSNAKVTLYPNPVKEELSITIETDKYDDFSIEFINTNGEILKNLLTDKTLYFSSKISVGNYAPGIYFIKVSNSKGSAVFKVIVQR